MWWLRKRTYLVFMLRELTSVFVVAYALFLMVVIWRADDPGSFSGLFDALDSPVSLVLHAIVLAALLFHSITWINLTPKVLVLWRDDEQVDPRLIAGANYLGWAVASAVLAWLVLK
jgi:fumarate reductase subunit C